MATFANSPEMRTQLAERIRAYLDAASDSRQLLEERWRRNEEIYLGLPPKRVKRPFRGAQYYRLPFTKPRLDRRRQQIVQTLTAFTPWLKLSRGAGDPLGDDPLERCLQYFMWAADLPGVLDRVVHLAMLRHKSIARVGFLKGARFVKPATVHGPYVGITLDAIDPFNFVCYPGGEGGIDGAKICGHRFDMSVEEVESLIASRVWFQAPVIGGAESVARDEFIVSSPAPSREDQLETVWDLLLREIDPRTGNEHLYRVIYGEQSQAIFSFEEYPYDLPWYVDFSTVWEPGRFFPQSGPSNDLQMLQTLLDACINEIVWGVQLKSRPPVFMEKGLDQRQATYALNEIIAVTEIGKVMPLPAAFEGGPLQFLLGVATQAADSVSNVNATLTGAQAGRRNTATAEELQYSAFQASVGSDVSKLGRGLARLGCVALCILDKQYSIWIDSVPEEVRPTKEAFQETVYVRPATEMPYDSPLVVNQFAGQLLQLMQMHPEFREAVPPTLVLRMMLSQLSFGGRDELMARLLAMEERAEAQDQMAAVQEKIAAATADPSALRAMLLASGAPPEDVAGMMAAQTFQQDEIQGQGMDEVLLQPEVDDAGGGLVGVPPVDAHQDVPLGPGE